MAATFTLTGQSHLPGGYVIVYGTCTMDESYATGGEVMDMSSYILSTDSPVIIFGGDDGYVLQSDRGTSAANLAIAYEAGADAASLDEVTAATNLAAVISPVIAIGKAA
jgi:hypothetical protein